MGETSQGVGASFVQPFFRSEITSSRRRGSARASKERRSANRLISRQVIGVTAFSDIVRRLEIGSNQFRHKLRTAPPGESVMTCMISNSEINTVRDLIDRMAGAQPELPFLISPETGRVLTFKGLQEQARHLYGRFRQMGLEHGDKIAFMMDNGLFTANLFLGMMYGGFVAVPLNVRGGVSQLSYTLDHCDAKVVFVGSQYDALIKAVMASVPRPVEGAYPVVPGGSLDGARARRLERRQAWVRLVARNHRQSCLWAPVAAAVGFRTPKKRDRVAWDNGISHRSRSFPPTATVTLKRVRRRR